VTVVEIERNPESEVLHWMLRSRAAREFIIGSLVGTDFASISHAAVFGAVKTLHENGAVVEPNAVAHAAHASPDFIMRFWQLSAYGTDVQVVGEVKEASSRRHLLRNASSLVRSLERGDAFDDRLIQTCNAIGDGLPRAAAQWESHTFAELASTMDTSYQWLVPWVIERGERLLLVGEEGRGKSVLLRQWAFQLACGTHWVTRRIIPPARVLIVDAENPQVKFIRASRWLHRLASMHGQDWQESRLRIITRPTLDLVGRRDHRDAIADAIERTQPDLLIIGPLYKVGRNVHQNYETSALAMTDILDDWRDRYGIAVMMEHHAPKANDLSGERDLNPKGSSVWMQWPDIGIKVRHTAAREQVEQRSCCNELRTHFHVGTTRGSRGSHIFPQVYRYGGHIANEWPWMADGYSNRDYDRDGNNEAVF